MVAMASEYDNFMKLCTITKPSISGHTHTRIPCKENKVFGGIFQINDVKKFYELYYNHIFDKKNKEYLTEKQNIDKGPILIDLDMRYPVSINTRQHTKEHIIDFIMLYLNSLEHFLDITDKASVDIFIMEKDNVNQMEDKTKDGIHIIIAISCPRSVQIAVRNKIKDKLFENWDDLNLTNNADELFDNSIVRGTTNWQMYGSRKPGHNPYIIKYIYAAIWHKKEGEWSLMEKSLDIFNIKDNLIKLSARNQAHIEFEIKKECLDELKKIDDERKAPKREKSMLPVVTDYKGIEIKDITSTTKLDEALEELFKDSDNNIAVNDLKEIHEYTMTLPEEFYKNGSYDKWIRVGWALKNHNSKLFLSWLKLSSKSSSFKWRDIGDLIERWSNFDYNNPDGLTAKSIMYWSKKFNPSEYYKVRETSISFHVDKSIKSGTEWDFAQVLYQMCKDEFVCVSIKNNIWYEFRDNRWHEIDSGNTLRLTISKKMHDIYLKKTVSLVNAMQRVDHSANKETYDKLKTDSSRLAQITTFLKKTNWKNNIMRESKELFYDRDFLNKVDSNPHLLCCSNYLIDFKAKCIRKGQADDYVSKCTNIEYISEEKFTSKQKKIKENLIEFMSQLFPDKELNQYMWDHLASSLIGTNDNQSFNIYVGSGRNGKSVLVNLMSKILGEYKATVPITLITQKRNSIGGTSSEIVQLMGVRYAVMQEPTKGDKINEGIMKEITGGDPIQGRALFKEAVTFIPQFKLAVCTNTLFDIKSNDDGTWRRIRVCDFKSKFLDKPYEDEEKFPKDDYPYQFPIDRQIEEKFEDWAPVMLSMLVNIAFKTNGFVKDCPIVLQSSNKYREGQDYLAEFVKERVRKAPGECIKQTGLFEDFKYWYTTNYGKNVPKARELYEYMDKRFGKYKGKWDNLMIVQDYDDDSD